MITQAIRTGQTADGGYGDNDAFPYIYNFIGADEDNGTITGAYGIGAIPAAGGSVRLRIHMDSDYIYIPRWIRLSPLFNNAGSYEWWDVPPTSMPLFNERMSDFGIPLFPFVGISMLYEPDARFVIQGNMGSPFTALQFAFPIDLLMGIDDGIAGVKMPYILPAQGNIVITLTNNHPAKPLFVGGCIYGWKIRI